MQPQDRIRELKRVKASTLVHNEKNWRTHPVVQQQALQGVLEEIGYADALLVREDEDGRLVLIDGHLRANTTPEAEVPVLVLDVTEEEADLLLTTYDPLSSMAVADNERLSSLLDSLSSENERVDALLESIREGEGINLGGWDNVQQMADPIPVEGFEEFSQLPTSNRCPQCAYEW